MRFLLLVFVALLCGNSVANEVFESCRKDLAIDAALEFGSNREKFLTIACRMEIDHSQVEKSEAEQTEMRTCSIFDDPKRKLKRLDAMQVQLRETGTVSLPPFSRFSNREKQTLLLDGRLQDGKLGENLMNFERVPDPWMTSITELSLLRKAESSAYWFELLDSDNLLWAEESRRFIRGEWSIGKGENEAFVQVYFEKDLGLMPSFVRYIRPLDREMKFVTKGRTFVSEIETKWLKTPVGWVPKECNLNRDNFMSKTHAYRSSEHYTFVFEWSSTLVDKDNAIRPEVFEPGKLSAEDVWDSFGNKRSEGTK